MMNVKRYDVVVIGAGMGGLSCGTLLAKEGLRVLICEQYPQRRIITPHFHLTLSTDIDRFERDLIHLFPKERLSIHAYMGELKRLGKKKKGLSIKSLDLIRLKEK